MTNPWTGEVALVIDGQQQLLKLTLGALAGLEQALEVGSLVELVERFEGGAFSSRDVLAVVVAGLQGGALQGGEARPTRADLMHAEIAGGPMAAARVAAELLARAFMLPEGV